MARTITDKELVNTASGGAGAEDTGTGLPVMADGRVLSEAERYGNPKSSYANHVIFKTSGTWTVPDGVTSLRVTCMGGRGGDYLVREPLGSTYQSPGGGSASCLNITANAGMGTYNQVGGKGGIGSGGLINGNGGDGGDGVNKKKNSNNTEEIIPAQPGSPGTNRAPAGGGGSPTFIVSQAPLTLAGGGGGGYAMGYVTVRPGQDVPYTVNGFGNPYVMIEY